MAEGSTLRRRFLRAVLALLLLVGSSALASGETAPDAEPVPGPVGEWLYSTFTGEDGAPWHGAFHVLSVERPQQLVRHSGVMVRCTAAGAVRPLVVTFAFGRVLRTTEQGEIDVEIAFTPSAPGEAGVRASSVQRLRTLNQANATFARGADAAFVARALESESVVVSARTFSGAARSLEVPLAGDGHATLEKLREACGAAAFPSSGPVAVAPASAPDVERSGARAYRDELVVDGTRFPFHVTVPAESGAAPPLFVVLHGGTRRPPWREREAWWRRMPFPSLLEDGVVLAPAAWRDAFWWSPEQRANVAALIELMQARHGVDPRRVYLIGVSDGGGGAMYLAMTLPVPVAGVVSVVGHPGVLYGPAGDAASTPAFEAMSSVPLLMINGAEDPLMPPDTLAPWIEQLEALDAPFEHYVQPGLGHGVELDEHALGLVRGFLLGDGALERPMGPAASSERPP